MNSVLMRCENTFAYQYQRQKQAQFITPNTKANIQDFNTAQNCSTVTVIIRQADVAHIMLISPMMLT